MIVENNSASRGSSNVQDQKGFWKTLWRLNIPNKVKSFARRASKNILPTKANLYHKRVTNDPMCVACGCKPKSSGYALWDCEKARRIEAYWILFDAKGKVFPEFIVLLWHLKFGQRL